MSNSTRKGHQEVVNRNTFSSYEGIVILISNIKISNLKLNNISLCKIIWPSLTTWQDDEHGKKV